MATLTQKAAFCCNPTHAHVDWLPEAASQSFKAGQFVYLNSGALTVCADDATAIWGMAIADASGTTGALCPVIRADAVAEFVMNVYHQTPASAVTAVTDRGAKKGLQVDSNKCYFDLEEASALAFQVQDIYLEPNEAIGDIYGKVKVRVLTDVAQAGAGEKTA